jgi:hypothetical protein
LTIKDERILDWRWRLNHFYKIVTKEGKLETFKENETQEQINNNRNRWKHILKYRQGGVTTLEVIKMLDFVCFHKNKNACILAHKKDTLEKIFNIVRLAYEHMPEKFKPIIGKGGGSKYEMFFPKMNSRIFVALDLRGGTNHWLHISEAAFADKMRVDATLETVPIDTGIVTFESTPNGLGNHFYKDWIDPDHKSAKLFFPWFFHSEYQMDAESVTQYTEDEINFIQQTKRMFNIDITTEQIAFRRHKKKTSTLFAQEYPENDKSCFLASGASAMDLEIVSRLLNSLEKPLEETGTLEIYKPFNANRRYACGADTAEGVGGDYSVATMYDVDSMEQVAQIRSNKWRPRKFAHEIYDLCSMYHKTSREWPLLGVELNNHGHAVLLELEEHLGYVNLYSYAKDKVGWRTDSITRPLMVDTFIDGVENETAKINSRQTLNECLTLIDNNGKIEAEAGEHDDCIISDALAIQMCILQRSNLNIYDDLSSKILL